MNPLEKLLREKLGYQFDFEFMQIGMVEEIIGTIDEVKLEQLITTIMNKKNNLVFSAILDQDRDALFTYMKSLGSQNIKVILTKAAQIIAKA